MIALIIETLMLTHLEETQAWQVDPEVPYF